MASRELADYKIDPLTLSAEENEQVAELIDENNALLYEVRELRSRLAQSAAAETDGSRTPPAKGGGRDSEHGGATPQQVEEMQAELARLMAENADLKTGVWRPDGGEAAQPKALATQFEDEGLKAKVQQLEAEVSRLQRQSGAGGASPAPANELAAEDEARLDELEEQNLQLVEENSSLIDKVNDLEDALALIKQSTAEVAMSGAGSLAGTRRLEAANHALQQRVSQLQAQIASPSSSKAAVTDEIAEENERLAMEIAAMQSQLSPGGPSPVSLAHKLPPPEGLPEPEDVTALRERNRQLLEENAALLDTTAKLQKAFGAPAPVPEPPSPVQTGPGDLETGEGVHPEVWALIEDLRADYEDLINKNAALAGSVTHLQKQQLQAGEMEMARLKLQDEVEGLQIRLAQVLNEKAASINEDTLKQLKSLQEDNLAMEEELARRAASAESGAQLVADQSRFLEEKKRLMEENAELNERVSKLLEENEALQQRMQSVINPRSGGEDGTSRSPAAEGERFGAEGNVALVRELTEENDLLITDNQRLQDSLKRLLGDNQELLNRIFDIAFDVEDSEGGADAGGQAANGGSHGKYISPAQLETRRKSMCEAYAPALKSFTPTVDEGNAASMSPDTAAATSARAMAFGRSPLGVTPDGDSPAGEASPYASAEESSPQAAVTPVNSPPSGPEADAAPVVRNGDTGKLRVVDTTNSAPEPDIASPVQRVASMGRGRRELAPEDLRRRHREIAEQVERDQELAAADASRRANLQQKTRQHLLAYEKVRADALVKLKKYASEFQGVEATTTSEAPEAPPAMAAAAAAGAAAQETLDEAAAAVPVPGAAEAAVVLTGEPAHAALVRRELEAGRAELQAKIEESRRLREDALAAKSAVAVESVRSAERRARQEKEELAKLRRRADELVRKAYFRYAGNEDIAAFMRALGYAFQPDAAGAVDDAALFKKALVLTHPDRNIGASLWDRALAEASHVKLQEWQSQSVH